MNRYTFANRNNTIRITLATETVQVARQIIRDWRGTDWRGWQLIDAEYDKSHTLSLKSLTTVSP